MKTIKQKMEYVRPVRRNAQKLFLLIIGWGEMGKAIFNETLLSITQFIVSKLFGQVR